jgi:N utilization substance protein B
MVTGRSASSPAGARSMARLAAVQALYQLEMTKAPVDHLVGEFDRYRLDAEIDGERLVGADRTFFASLVRHSAEAESALDETIASVLTPEWKVGRLDSVLRAILRLGCYELGNRPDIPARVVLSEYVDLARAFFEGKEPALVNGVLDRLARRLRPEEFEGTADERS